MASGPYHSTDTLTFVVNDPLAPAPPVYGTATQLVFLNSPSNSAVGTPSERNRSSPSRIRTAISLRMTFPTSP